MLPRSGFVTTVLHRRNGVLRHPTPVPRPVDDACGTATRAASVPAMSRLALDTDELTAAALALRGAADHLAAAREHLEPRGDRPAGHPSLDGAIRDLGAGWSARHGALVEALASQADALRGAADRYADAERVTLTGLARLLVGEHPAGPGGPAPGATPGGAPTTATAL
jgi:hypothetical protein